MYKTLSSISDNPCYLFAFEYFRKFLVESNSAADQQNAKKISVNAGRGFKKALDKWYNSYNELDLLFMITKYKSSHLWSNKDFFKLYHVKPKNEAVNLVIKYVMFGFDRVKDDKSPEGKALIEFIKDLESVNNLSLSFFFVYHKKIN